MSDWWAAAGRQAGSCRQQEEPFVEQVTAARPDCRTSRKDKQTAAGPVAKGAQRFEEQLASRRDQQTAGAPVNTRPEGLKNKLTLGGPVWNAV